jgi:hypothetical protein
MTFSTIDLHIVRRLGQSFFKLIYGPLLGVAWQLAPVRGDKVVIEEHDFSTYGICHVVEEYQIHIHVVLVHNDLQRFFVVGLVRTSLIKTAIFFLFLRVSWWRNVPHMGFSKWTSMVLLRSVAVVGKAFHYFFILLLKQLNLLTLLI